MGGPLNRPGGAFKLIRIILAQKAGKSAVRKLLIPLYSNSKNRIAHNQLLVGNVLENLTARLDRKAR